MGLVAWFMDSSEEDQRKPHKLTPDQPVSLEELRQLGVFHWKVRERYSLSAQLLPSGSNLWFQHNSEQIKLNNYNCDLTPSWIPNRMSVNSYSGYKKIVFFSDFLGTKNDIVVVVIKLLSSYHRLYIHTSKLWAFGTSITNIKRCFVFAFRERCLNVENKYEQL